MLGRSCVFLVALASLLGAIFGACPPKDVSLLTESDVLELLETWNLAHAFGKTFGAQHVDGFKLQYLCEQNVDRSDYPGATSLDFAALWGRLQACGLTGSGKMAESTSSGAQERRLSAAGSSGEIGGGIRIKHNASAISLGSNSDIMLRRTSDNILQVDNYLQFCEDDAGLVFCNGEGDDIVIETDHQGNLYVGGTVHFTGNVTMAGLHIDEYIARKFDDLMSQRQFGIENPRSCLDILGSNSSAADGVYLVIGDKSDHDPQYVYCDMSNGGWTLLMRYDEDSGYVSGGSVAFGTPTVPTSSGGTGAPIDRIWAPVPSGNDDGHVDMLAFNMTGGRLVKGVCSRSSTTYSYKTTLFDDWAGGIYGTYKESGSSAVPVGWAVLGATDIGGGGRSNHFVCGSQAYTSGGGIGLCSGVAATSTWTPHRASISFWPTGQYVGCAGGDGSHFEFWIQ